MDKTAYLFSQELDVNGAKVAGGQRAAGQGGACGVREQARPEQGPQRQGVDRDVGTARRRQGRRQAGLGPGRGRDGRPGARRRHRGCQALLHAQVRRELHAAAVSLVA
ncbi:hypothetical protein L1887_48906 [Cichorium endivia]|nr:hypothetical protein L1887_48906 [Cichorium endivia]